nr:unnamed protein product [Digitaria exilis]
MMNSRAFQFQLQAAEAAAAPVHAADEDKSEPTIPMPLQLETIVVAQATADPPPPPPGQGSGVAPAGVVIKCPECPKKFTSEKAMFGHLRKHPERGYKGATRPATATSAAAAVAGDKKRRKHAVAHKEDDVSAMNMTVDAATTAGEKEAELSTKWPAVAAKRGHATFVPTDEDQEAAMILLEMASSSRSTTSETQHESVQQQVLAAPDAVPVHQTQQGVVQVQPMLLDHVAAGHHQITPEAEQIVRPPEIIVELSAESGTTPAAVNKELTNLEITTEAVLIVVPANKKPIVPSPGAKKQQTSRKRPAAQLDLEQISAAAAAAASPAPPDNGGKSPVKMRRIPSPASNKKHECLICDKAFPTYQALGGHMSSHSKGKTTAGARHDDLAVAQAAMHNILARRYQQQSAAAGSSVVVPAASTGGLGTGWGQDVHLQDVPPPSPTVAAPAAQSAPASPHVCTKCQMTFPSGQALGGHKRKHWFPEKYQAKAAAAEVAAAPAVAEAAPAEIASPAPARATVAREFDLNELPDEEGEGESNQP